MDKIFKFIFECLSDIFNFLDFKLPNIELTYVDFLIIVPIIVVIFKLVKGVVGESGDGILFGGMNSISNSVESYSKLSYKNYERNRERNDFYNKKYSRFHNQDLVYTNNKSNKQYLRGGGVFDS